MQRHDTLIEQTNHREAVSVIRAGMVGRTQRRKHRFHCFVVLGLVSSGCVPESDTDVVSVVGSEIRNPTAVGLTDLLGMVQVAGATKSCSGMAISDTAVLTAAHCFCSGNTVGGNVCEQRGIVYMRRNPNTNASAQPIEGNVFAHPDYNPTVGQGETEHDLAILRLDAPLPSYVASFEIAATYEPIGSTVIVAGFGKTGETCDQAPAGLNYDYSVIDDYEDGHDFIVVDPLKFCNGDSGGAVLRADAVPTKLLAVHSGAGFFVEWEDFSVTTTAHKSWIESTVPDLYAPLGRNEQWTQTPYYGGLGTFVADVNGDGRSDAIVVNGDRITVRRSTGAGFAASQWWTSGPYYGGVGTYFADIDTNGRADAIAVNADGIWVRRSTGTEFGPLEQWSGIPYYGGIGTYFADVTGDNRADAIAVNADAIVVRRATLSGFGANEYWSTYGYYGQVGTHFADVTGDRKADAIVVNPDGIYVRRSNGSGFGALEAWSTVPYYGDKGTYFVDADADGRADAVVSHTTEGVLVRRSTGSAFAVDKLWSQQPYFGGVGTYVDDVTGDRRADFIAVNADFITVRRARGY